MFQIQEFTYIIKSILILKNVTVSVTTGSYIFFAKNVDNVQGISNHLIESIRENIGNKYSNMIENLSY